MGKKAKKAKKKGAAAREKAGASPRGGADTKKGAKKGKNKGEKGAKKGGKEEGSGVDARAQPTTPAPHAAAPEAPTVAHGVGTSEPAAAPASAPAPARLIVTARVRQAVRAEDLRLSTEFVDALNARVERTIVEAVGRAKGNGRATVRGQDL